MYNYIIFGSTKLLPEIRQVILFTEHDATKYMLPDVYVFMLTKTACIRMYPPAHINLSIMIRFIICYFHMAQKSINYNDTLCLPSLHLTSLQCDKVIVLLYNEM